MYQDIVSILTDLIFGGSLEGVMYGQLIVEGISAILCTILVLMPFTVVWRIVKRLL